MRNVKILAVFGLILAACSGWAAKPVAVPTSTNSSTTTTTALTMTTVAPPPSTTIPPSSATTGTTRRQVPVTAGTTATARQPVTTTTTAAPTTTTTVTVPMVWRTVATLSGAGNAQGAQFELLGGQQRLSWTCTRFFDLGASFYVKGGTYQPSIDCTAASGASYLYDAAGDYHLAVIAVDNDLWSVKLEELRPASIPAPVIVTGAVISPTTTTATVPTACSVYDPNLTLDQLRTLLAFCQSQLLPR